MELEDIKHIPNKPGIYIWKDHKGDVIYVGKAKQLHKRLTQYIKGSINSYKTQRMMKQAKSVDYFVTKTNKEALLLERNYIAKFKPEYNILLMDDKNYPYIMIKLRKSSLLISLIYRVGKRDKNTVFFGPFPTGYGAKRMANLLNRIAVYEKGLPARTNSHIYWKKQFETIKKYIASDGSLLEKLKSQMSEASENQKYEIAHDIKETLDAMVFSKERQAIDINDKSEIDAIAFYEKDGYLSYTQTFYRQGKMLSSKSSVVEIMSSKLETIRQFIVQFYNNHPKPNLLVSNFAIEHNEIRTSIPLRGEKKAIVEIALENSKENVEMKLANYIRKEEITIGALNELKDILRLKKLRTILMVDNSNTANENPVSAIVAFKNGTKDKANYKRFVLEKTNRNADVEYMRQAVSRYFSNKENLIPDLFIVDGGKAQFNEVKKIIPEIPIIGLVKNDKHVTEAMIDLDGARCEINNANVLIFLRGIQKEVDRFAKSLHRSRATKSTLEGKLMSIKGIGAQTEKKLLDNFKTYSAIFNASIEDLSKIVDEKMAKRIFKEIKR